MKKRVNNFFYMALIAFSFASLLTFSAPKQQMHAASTGKEIVISLSDQMLYAFEDGDEVYETYVTTGQPALPTPTGSFSIFRKQSPMTFYSPWGKNSPYYFPPTNVSYAMEFAGGGYYIHDAPWRGEFGPGTNSAHVEEDSGKEMTGSHGCVNTPVDDAAWLYDWAPIGTPVKVVS
ncbi:L,D-transpeptidase [Ktedonospora formicarum]|uniref:L,D-TPase catalytic domain-containing protein n=1 Tax=Ktedonospora formicarum TaxID=2778364 RepID=A0A8J3HWW3_9CHLR|nr:L,D-transpeptidase [Ktedonospora formicarum]GHO45587.1 hypothetical protein KSX_37500 [Ktedonospora formicarum]